MGGFLFKDLTLTDDQTPKDPRPVGIATFGDISKIIDDLAPVLDPVRQDLKLIALAAIILILLDEDISLENLPLGTDILIKTASKFVTNPDTYIVDNTEWENLPTNKVN